MISAVVTFQIGDNKDDVKRYHNKRNQTRVEKRKCEGDSDDSEEECVSKKSRVEKNAKEVYIICKLLYWVNIHCVLSLKQWSILWNKRRLIW